MREKDLKSLVLYDVYAPLLSEKKREVFEMYFFEDLSLSEISEHTGTSRQGVRELIVRTSSELAEYEKALGLVEKEERDKKSAEKLLDISQRIESVFKEEAEEIRQIVSVKGE